MSENTTPITAFFQLQRDTIRGTEEVFEAALDAPREFGEAFNLTGESGRETRDQTLEISRESLYRSLDAVESLPGPTPGINDLRESVDETFDELEAQNADACSTVTAEYETLESNLQEIIQEQMELYVEFNEELETQLVETVETMSEGLGEATAAPSETAAEITEIEITEAESGTEDPVESAPEGKVECLVCGEYFSAITYPHLQTHDMTIEEYREEFGTDVPLRPDE